jgi:uncharacterized protein YjgD (DUF1641 family)
MTEQLDRIEAKLDRLQAALNRAGPLLDELPGVLATVGNIADDLALKDGHARMDQRVRGSAAALAELTDPAVLRLITAAVAEIPGAAAAPIEHHGLFALLRVLREDEVQRSLSFLIQLARRLGPVLDEQS